MLNAIKGIDREIIINGRRFQDGISAIENADLTGEIEIKIPGIKEKNSAQEILQEMDNTQYVIKVRRYMTRPATPEFDFMDKWNKGIPMPMRIMVGRELQETKGMVKMELRGDIIEEFEDLCMKCGRKLTNPISKYFGIGPECGGHDYVHPFETEEELRQAIGETRKKLQAITWTGWIIKSALEKFELIRQESID